MVKPLTYNDIYLDLLEKYDVGLAEILGPTGNGKTSALYKDFNNEGRFILNEIAKAKRQAIFMTDRKNIVKEVAQACEQAGIKHVYYRANHEILIKIVREKRVNQLLAEIDKLDLFKEMRFHTEYSLRRLFSEVQRLLKMTWNYKDVNEHCSDILKACREAIGKCVKSSSPSLEVILNSPWIQELFPFLAFTHDTSNVLLIGTTQRLGYPMFNGESHKSVYELSGYYIFIDEFDRQVDAFLDHLVEDKKNLRPEIFVSHFCEYYQGKTGESDTTQKGVEIAATFGQALSEMGLQFPRGKTDNYKFSNADKLFKRTEKEAEPFGYIFDSGYTVSSDLYYLRDNFKNPYEGELVFTKEDNYASFLEFYQTIREFEIKIFNFFANLKNGKKVDEESYRTLLTLIYDIKNDEEVTEYHKFIDQNSPAFRPKASEFLREILHKVENHYFRKDYETPEQLIVDLDLPETFRPLTLLEEQPLSADWQDSLVIYQGQSSTTLTLPNLAILSPQWTLYLLAWENSVVLSPPENSQLVTNARPVATYTLPRRDVVKIRKHLQRPNAFQIIKVFPLVKRLRCDDSFFTRGYVYNQIIDRHTTDSENRLEVNHYSLKMTPEARLFMLATHNLVFGISATSDISQQYAHFSLPWVRTALSVFRQSQPEEKRQRICIPDAGNRGQYDAIIANILETKEKTRQTQLHGSVRNACELDKNDEEWSERILNGLQELRGNGVDLYGHDKDKQKNRLDRVSFHFEAFRWIIEESHNDTHLIFTDTFSNTLKVFKYMTATPDSEEPAPTGFAAFRTCLRRGHTEAIAVELIRQPSNDNSEESKEEPKINTVFLFTINRPSSLPKSAYIIFANANTWGDIYEDNKRFYNSIFQRGLEEQRKVMVITQHASASNGVNLQYELTITQEDGTTKSVERDFESFYMSHPLYYFFASNYDDDLDIQGQRRETSQDIKNKEKSLYKASKLTVGQVIGRHDLKQFIGGGSELNFVHLNKIYKNSEDCRKYMITLLTQEIGRIERTRDKAKPAEVTLPEEIRRIIERTDFPDNNSGARLSETLFENRQSRLSPLLKAIIQDIRNTAREKHHRNEAEYESIGKMTIHYKGWMEKLLEVEFDKLRKGQLAEDAARSLRRLWEGMREAALKGDFHWRWSDKEHFKFEFDLKELGVFTTSHISPNPQGEAEIFIRHEGGEEHILPEDQAGAKIYRPNKVYEVVRDNEVVSNYFRSKGFKERFDFSYQENNLVFIPEFQKAVLQGAIGEEALKALLKQVGLEIEDSDNIPHELFELVDFKIKGLPIYVDAKHWDDSVIENFENAEGEAVSHKLTHKYYVKKGRETLSAIQRVTGEKNAKVVYINLLFSEGKNYTQRTYYRNEDCSRKVHTWEEASFVYLAGALSRQDKNKHHEIFDTFLEDVRQELAKLNG